MGHGAESIEKNLEVGMRKSENGRGQRAKGIGHGAESREHGAYRRIRKSECGSRKKGIRKLEEGIGR
jgi:hypothetical protein